MSVARVIAVALLALGVGLHTYIWSFEASSFAIQYWLLALVPYAASGILLFLFKRPHAAAGAMILPALLDVATFYSVFIDPRGSTAALGLILVPLWNIAIFAPIGAAIGWWVGYRIRITAEDMPSNNSLERTREG
jgi:hypothetical protein